MSATELAACCPPPLTPFSVPGVGDWERVEASLGIRFPLDYKESLSRYGSGGFGDFLYLLNPFFLKEGYAYTQQVSGMLEAYRALKEITPAALPYSCHPEPGGLYPAAVTDNGDVLYWVTAASPDDWPVVIYNSRHWRHEEVPLSLTALLTAWLAGSLSTRILPKCQPTFRVYGTPREPA